MPKLPPLLPPPLPPPLPALLPPTRQALPSWPLAHSSLRWRLSSRSRRPTYRPAWSHAVHVQGHTVLTHAWAEGREESAPRGAPAIVRRPWL